jgi:flagellar hook-associated protein 3 FlgL
MTMNTIGDTARAFGLRNQQTALKKDIQRLNTQLATGQTADIARHLGGSYARLTGIERDMRVLDGYKVSIAEATQFTELMQGRMGQMNDIAADFARDLIGGNATQGPSSAEALTAEGRLQFSSVVTMLNSEAAGRSLFAGDKTDVNPLVDADAFLGELETVVAGATTAADVETALDAWFASPAGFDSFAYQGSTTGLAPLKMSETASMSVDIRADDKVFKDILKGLAMAAMADAPGTSLSAGEKGKLFSQSGTALLTAESGLIGLAAKLGVAQEQIDQWSVRNQSELAGLQYAKGALLTVDPYETATELEAAQFQLESLYAVTVRLSQLSLVNFLR